MAVEDPLPVVTRFGWGGHQYLYVSRPYRVTGDKPVELVAVRWDFKSVIVYVPDPASGLGDGYLWR